MWITQTNTTYLGRRREAGMPGAGTTYLSDLPCGFPDLELPFGKEGTGKGFAASSEDPLCSEPLAWTFLCLGTEESLELLLVLLALRGGSWLQVSASGFDRLSAGLLGFWEEEDEEEEDEEEADTGRGGSISFLEDSEEGLGVFVLEDSVWEEEDDAV